MSLRINNNITSLNAQRNLQNNDAAVGRSLERLSSGLRINKAADDAAGLVISEQMRAQITGLNQAIANSETAVSMVQTAEGALDEVNSLLLKARQLALHAANEGANDTNQLIADQNELDNVIDAISRISDFTQFGTKKLLDGSLNGASNLGQGVERVEVGNLANNAAVATGRMDVDVSGFTRESNFVTSTGSFTNGTGVQENRLFDGNVTGLDLDGLTLQSGAQASLTIDGSTRTITAGTGGLSANQIAAEWDEQFSDFNISYNNTDGGFDIQSRSIGPNSFTSSIEFSRA
ncbi:MAG: flagellin, partial [Planctomycetota bacterium]